MPTLVVTALPLPDCVYIAIVHRSSEFCCDQIKDFVDTIKRALNIFIGNQKAQLQRKSIFGYASDSNGAKDYEIIVEEIITKLNGN